MRGVCAVVGIGLAATGIYWLFTAETDEDRELGISFVALGGGAAVVCLVTTGGGGNRPRPPDTLAGHLERLRQANGNIGR